MAPAVAVSPIPSLPIDLAAGAAYGPVWGATYAVIGAEIGAVVSFLIARARGREWLYTLLRLDIRFCEQCSDRHLVTLLVLARLLPVGEDLSGRDAGTGRCPRLAADANDCRRVSSTELLRPRRTAHFLKISRGT
jgi:membrane protein DedA with SNARE-associated domain